MKKPDLDRSLGYALAAMLALLTSPVIAGSCKIQSFNGQSVQVCDNGYVETTGRDGRTRSYGFRNGGVARYPESFVPDWARQNRR